MFSALSFNIKVAIVVAIGLLIGYVYYDVIVKPQNEIERLEEVVEEQKAIPTKIVNKINKADANRTQKEIDETEYIEDFSVRDRGILFF